MADALPQVQNFDVPTVQAGVLSAKGAALRAIAAGGSQALQMSVQNQAAQSQFANGAAMTAAANAGSVGGAGAASGFAAQEGAQAGASFAPLQQAAQMQGDAGQAFTGLISQANENYGNQVAQAVPLVQEQTGRELQSLTARAQSAEADRSQARALAQLQMQNAREDRSASGAQNAINLERSKIGLESDKLSLQKQREAQAAAANGPALTDNDYRAIKGQVDKATQDYGNSFAPALARLSGSKVNDKGEVEKNRGYQAVEAMIDRGLTAEQAAAEFRSPTSGKPLSEAAIQDWYDQYQKGLALQLGQSPDYYRYLDYVNKQNRPRAAATMH